MNAELLKLRFSGQVLDLGGGRDSSYLSFHPDVGRITNFDIKAGKLVDFEKDKLPIADNAFDTVLLFNVLEHLFNYRHIVCEGLRVTKDGGTLHGFVPFLLKFHPDPQDYFRYTDTALKKILNESGWQDVKVSYVGAGPYISAIQQMIYALPVRLRVPTFLLFWLLDRHYSGPPLEYPLGYYFCATKAEFRSPDLPLKISSR